MIRIAWSLTAFLLIACAPTPDKTFSEAQTFWNGTDFSAKGISVSPQTAEERFADYIRLLNDELPADQAGPLLQDLLAHAGASDAAFRLFAELCEKYLYAPQSPTRNDELYLFALERIIESPYLNDYEKLRPRCQREMALRNRTGEPATDFIYTLPDGSRSALYGIEADYTVLFFSDPDCDACSQTVQALQHDPTIAALEQAGRLRTLALYSNPEERIDQWRAHLGQYPPHWIAAYDDGARIHYEGRYDLRSTPCIYLLDANKRVLAKGAVTIEPIAQTLRRQEARAEEEKWWAAIVSQGQLMPVEGSFRSNLIGDTYGNQVQPLLLSDRGNVIWSEEPFEFAIENGAVEIRQTLGKVERVNGGKTLRDAYAYASKHFFKPQGKLPAELFFSAPQYNTWIELMYDQNQQDILRFAEQIVAHGFPPGVLMIDDTWQEDYGKWDFHPGRFSDPKEMIRQLHALGFKVMLWVCPFVSPDSDVYRELAEKGAFLTDNSGGTVAAELPTTLRGDRKPLIVSWWNGCSAVLDLSNPVAREWFTGRLDRLQREFGVDGFKFDAGDAEYYTAGSSYGGVTANTQTELFGEIGLKYPFNEYRAMWKMGGQPLVERLRDKGHNWNDLRKLVPSMNLAGLAGYTFCCPDMVGGGEFTSFLEGAPLDQELFVRSAQCHALMPMMQFSAAPWRILDAAHYAAVEKCVALRQRFAGYILDQARESALTGEPIMRNMEYAFPGMGFSRWNHQFLLGNRLLVAPVVAKGVTQQRIQLPPGRWAGFDGRKYTGPAVITVPVGLDTLPYFERIDNE